MANTQAPTQDGESFIRIADRDRCKPIASSTCVCIRVCQCIHVPMQRRCAGARRRAHRGSASESLIRVADRGRCSPITCAPTQAHFALTQRTHGDTHLHVTRSPSIHAHHAANEYTHAHANKYDCNSITRCTSVLLSYYYGIMVLLFVIVATRTPACSQVMQMRSV